MVDDFKFFHSNSIAFGNESSRFSKCNPDPSSYCIALQCMHLIALEKPAYDHRIELAEL